jgi:hypothetical protein
MDKEKTLAIVSQEKANIFGKKSVRTTLKLSKEAHDQLKELLEFYNETSKNTLEAVLSEDMFSSFKEILENSTQNIEQKNNFIRKTFVLTRNTLKRLETEAVKLEISRDKLAQLMISLNYFIVKDLQEKSNKALEMIKGYAEKGVELEKEIHFLLSKEDPIPEFFSNIIKLLLNFENIYLKGHI